VGGYLVKPHSGWLAFVPRGSAKKCDLFVGKPNLG
jgi:hypothetical protein